MLLKEVIHFQAILFSWARADEFVSHDSPWSNLFLNGTRHCSQIGRFSFSELLVQAFKAHDIPENTAVTRGGAQHAADVLEDAKSKGTKFLLGGIEWSGPAGLKPSIVVEPGVDTRIHDEETFEPSVSLCKLSILGVSLVLTERSWYADTDADIVNSDEDAITRANDSSYGLNATIHTRNMERGLQVASELEYGQVHINSTTVYVSSNSPQGGVKGSGWGRQNASWGLENFYQTKFVSWHGRPHSG